MDVVVRGCMRLKLRLDTPPGVRPNCLRSTVSVLLGDIDVVKDW
jgi:hypothetical protein